MNFYKKPENDIARLATLKKLHQKGVQDQQEGITYLTAETLTQLGSFIPQLTMALNALQESNALRRSAAAAAKTAVAAVAKHSRDIWSAVKRRTSRDGLPAALYSYYGLSATGKNPQLQTAGEWLVMAEQIIVGEAAVVAAGFPALTGPDVADLQNKVAAAATAISQRDAAKTAYKAMLALVSTRRAEADELIAETMNQLRFALYKETASLRREIMRGYGARFSQKTEEAPAIAEDAETETLAVPAAMSILQPYAVSTVNGNGTAVHV